MPSPVMGCTWPAASPSRAHPGPAQGVSHRLVILSHRQQASPAPILAGPWTRVVEKPIQPLPKVPRRNGTQPAGDAHAGVVRAGKGPEVALQIGKGLEHEGVRHAPHQVAYGQAQVLPGDRPHHAPPDDAPHTIGTHQKVGGEHLAGCGAQGPCPPRCARRLSPAGA